MLKGSIPISLTCNIFVMSSLAICVEALSNEILEFSYGIYRGQCPIIG